MVGSYHHGDLREALTREGLALAREGGGPQAVTIREASRRAGVSHNAAYRHFSDRIALVDAVAERARTELAQRMLALIAAVDPADESLQASRDRWRATGLAYVRFAIEEPGWFRTAFVDAARTRQFGPDDPEARVDEATGPFEVTRATVNELIERGDVPAEAGGSAEIIAWAGVHGLSVLFVDGSLRHLPRATKDVLTSQMLDTLNLGLRAEGPPPSFP